MEQLANIGTIQDTIKERIQKEFVSLIPDEAWKKLVQGQIDWFMTRPNKSYHSSSKYDPAPLDILVRKELEKMFSETIVNYINTEMSGVWDQHGDPAPTEAIKKMVKEIAPEIWEIAIAGIITRAVDGLKNQISQMNY